MGKAIEWTDWRLIGVQVGRRSVDDESVVDLRFIPQPRAMPAGKCHCTRTWRGGSVFLNIMGNDVECVGDAQAEAIMGLFRLQHGLGAASSAISEAVTRGVPARLEGATND